MNIGYANARGINNIEHWYYLEREELKKRGHNIYEFNLRYKPPEREKIKELDIIHFHFAQVANYYKRIGKKFIISPHAHDIFVDKGKTLKKASSHKNCVAVSYQSFYHKRKFEEWGIEKPLYYLPMCCRTELFKRKKKYNKNGKIVAGGRLVPKKGLDRLVNVDNLTIFGDGPLESELKSLMPNTTFTGRLSSEELRDLFDEASLYLFPAIVTPNNDSDGIANTLKESLLMELPVVASSVAGTPELNNINILDDWDNISMKISSILKKPNIKGRKEILKKYSPDVCVEKLLNGINKYI